jgi:hypothetical protein
MAKRTLTANVRGMCKLLLLVVFAVFFQGGTGCPGPIIPNPNRKLLLSKERDYFLFNPVWHPDGERIYYLAIPDSGQWYGQPPYDLCGGGIWSIRADGTDDRPVLDGCFYGLTISRDGEKLAFMLGRYPIERESTIVVADTSGTIVDTIRTTGGAVSWVRFSRKDDTKLYYSSWIHRDTIGYFRINLDGSGEELILARGPDGAASIYFDLSFDDSLYLHPVRLAHQGVPSFFPQADNYVVYPVQGYEFQTQREWGDLILKNLVTGEEDSLYADPFGLLTYIDFPSWSPEGNRIVYCAGPWRGDPVWMRELELWMIENVEPGKNGMSIGKRR